jgi:tetratricopeptide (TPR) repeat protein
LLQTGGSTELAALGQTPNLAARLQGEAGHNQLLISQTTHRLAGQLFETISTGPLRLKGFQDPIVAYRVEGESEASSRWEEASPTHLSPLVGRSAELALLEDRWAKSKDGSGQVVLITAEPGVGKSRLVQEFRQRLREEAHATIPLYCTPYHTSSAFHPITDILRRRLGLGADRAPEERLDVLEHWLGELGLATQKYVPLLGPLLSVAIEPRYAALDLSGDERRRRTMDALTAVAESLCGKHPVLLIGEDLHWIDPTTQQWLSQLVELGRTGPLLMLLTFRPEYEAPWRGEPHLTEVRLNHLTRGECRSFVGHLAAHGRLSESLIDQIVKRTDGVPLYVEELSRAALEAEDPEAIPETLKDALTARLDRLGSAKQVAQVAATLGREFPSEVLPAVSQLSVELVNAALTTLLASGLVHRIRSTATGDYQFKHALVRDAAYESLLRAPRQSIHQRAAEALVASEEQTPPEIVAYHFEQAGVFDRAESHWEQAGVEALNRGADEEAMVHFRRALELAQTHHGSAQRCLRLTNRLARTLHLSGKRIEAKDLMLGQASLASVVTDVQLVGYYHRTCGLIHSFLGKRGLARESFEKALAAGRKVNDSRLVAGGQLGLGWEDYFTSRFREAQTRFEDTVTLLTELRPQHSADRRTLRQALYGLGYAKAELGELSEARVVFTKLAELKPAPGSREMVNSAEIAAWVDLMAGDWNKVIERMTAELENEPPPFSEALLYQMLSTAYLGRGDVDRALPMLELALEKAKRYRGRYEQLGVALQLGHAYCESGRWDDAAQLAQESLRGARETESPIAGAQLLLGRIELERGAMREARNCLENALRSFSASGRRPMEARTHLYLASLGHAEGKLDEARGHLHAAHQVYSDMGASWFVAKIASLTNEFGVPIDFDDWKGT